MTNINKNNFIQSLRLSTPFTINVIDKFPLCILRQVMGKHVVENSFLSFTFVDILIILHQM